VRGKRHDKLSKIKTELVELFLVDLSSKYNILLFFELISFWLTSLRLSVGPLTLRTENGRTTLKLREANQSEFKLE